MKKKIFKVLLASLLVSLIYSSSALAWEPTLVVEMTTNNGHDMSIYPNTFVNHTYFWDGNYSSFSGTFYAKEGYSKNYNNVVYNNDSLKTFYSVDDYATTATISMHTNLESGSSFIHVYVLH